MSRYLTKTQIAEALDEIAYLAKQIDRKLEDLWGGTPWDGDLRKRLDATEFLSAIDTYAARNEAKELSAALLAEDEAERALQAADNNIAA